MTVKNIAKWSFVVLLLLGATGFALISFNVGGPRAAYGFVRYALPQMRRGDLRAGDMAPNFEAIPLDGGPAVTLHEHIGSRPLVLIFGSYT